jgi:hypothetical protein
VGTPDGVAQKRRVLVDALTMCLERSKVCEVVDAQTIRSVLASAAGEMWREGEFRLEYVWKILCQQPGLSAKEVAPPLLVFKAYEAELGVNVRVPEALSALPRGEQVRLRDELRIEKTDFAKVIADLQAVAAAESAKAAQAQIAAQAAAQSQAKQPDAPPDSSYAPPKGKNPAQQKKLAIALGAVALVALPAALFLTFRETSLPVDTSDVAAFVKLSEARREGPSLSAKIVDPGWEAAARPDQQKRAEQAFELENKKGVQAMTLTDGQGRTRIIATDAGGKHQVIVR